MWSSGHYNWYAGAQNNLNNAFEFTPSTATDGSTFSTPVLKIAQTGSIQTKNNTLDDGSGNLTLVGAISSTPATDTSTGTINNLTSSSRSVVRFNQNTTITLNGIAAGTDGQLLMLLNNTGNSMTVNSESGSATGKQIQTGGNAAITVRNGGSLFLVYNNSTTLWWALSQ